MRIWLDIIWWNDYSDWRFMLTIIALWKEIQAILIFICFAVWLVAQMEEILIFFLHLNLNQWNWVENFYRESIEKAYYDSFMDDEQVIKLVDNELTKWDFFKGVVWIFLTLLEISAIDEDLIIFEEIVEDISTFKCVFFHTRLIIEP
jgi:hypothetical protein